MHIMRGCVWCWALRVDAYATQTGQVKNYLRRHMHTNELAAEEHLHNALGSITLEQGIHYFRDCGYHLGDAALAEARQLGAV